MAKSTRPTSPSSTITSTSTTKIGPGGRKYTTRIEKSRPTYEYRVETKTTTELAIPDEVELNTKHFKSWPGLLKILQLVVAILCMVFFSPPLTWFTRFLCAVVASCFAITIFICLFYLFTLFRIVMPTWPWLKITSRPVILNNQETLYTNGAAVLYLVSSLLQLIFTNKEEFRIALEYHNYYYDYIVAGVVGLINFVLYALGGQLLHNKLRVFQDRQPKVCIVRTTLDKNGKPIKKTIKKQHHHQVKIHKIETV